MGKIEEKDASQDELEPLSSRERWAERWEQTKFFLFSALLLILLFVGFFWNHVLITIPAGHHGVLFRRFTGGTELKQIWPEGMHVIFPWNKLIAYETRIKSRTSNLKLLSSEGLEVNISAIIRYQLVIENLGYLHRDIGPDYFDRIIDPEIQAQMRQTFGERRAQEIYTSVHEITQEVSRVPLLSRLESAGRFGGDSVAKPYVHLEEIRIVNVVLPQSLVNAINEKQRQEQLLLEYKYRLEREAREAERKRTEAAGIRDANSIASRISPDLLRWRGIEAALELSKSTNSKVIVLGGGQGAPPMMLNVGDLPNSPSGNSAPPSTSSSAPASALSATTADILAAAAPAKPAEPVKPAPKNPAPR